MLIVTVMGATSAFPPKYMSAMRRSFHTHMNWKIASEAIAGTEIGMMRLKKIWGWKPVRKADSGSSPADPDEIPQEIDREGQNVAPCARAKSRKNAGEPEFVEPPQYRISVIGAPDEEADLRGRWVLEGKRSGEGVGRKAAIRIGMTVEGIAMMRLLTKLSPMCPREST